MRLLGVLLAFTLLAGCGAHAHRAHHRTHHPRARAPVALSKPHATVKHHGKHGKHGKQRRFALTGPPSIGQTLFSSTGTWANVPTGYAYQWQHCDVNGANCVNISGATGSSYQVVAGDSGFSLRVVVTATNQLGSASSPSAATQVVAGAPVNTGLPVITGNTTQGSTLSTTNGTWTGSPTSFTYQWLGCDTAGNNCVNITGATSSTYTLQATDVGRTIRVVVTAINAAGSASATSTQTATVTSGVAGAPVPTASPTITDSTSSGRWQYADTLTASGDTWTVSGGARACGPSTGMVCAFQWQRSADGGVTWANIITGDCLVVCSRTYRVQTADVGTRLRVIVTAGDTAGSTDATAATTGTVVAATCNFTDSSASALNTDYQNAAAGQTVCLASGSYTWSPTVARAAGAPVLVQPAAGATVSMTLDANPAANVMIAGPMTIDHGTIYGAAHDVTLYNTTVVSGGAIDLFHNTYSSSSNIVVDDDNMTSGTDSCIPAPSIGKIAIHTIGASVDHYVGITASNNYISGAGGTNPLDGIRVDDGARGVQIIGNEFTAFTDTGGCGHGDYIQVNGGHNITMKNNFFYSPGDSSNLAGASFGGWGPADHGPDTFENNVVAGGGSPVTLGGYDSINYYNDNGSTLEHNVFEYAYGLPCLCASNIAGDIAMTTNIGGAASTIRDNVYTSLSDFSNPNCTPACVPQPYYADHNLCHFTCEDSHNVGTGTADISNHDPTYIGGSGPSTLAGFGLANGSYGIGSASDGTNIGLELPTNYPYPR